MAHRNSARRSAAQPMARYIKIDTFSTAIARRPFGCLETLPCLTFLYSFPGSWVEHVPGKGAGPRLFPT
eukprot:280643-Pyramimonas_sp.AAC.1